MGLGESLHFTPMQRRKYTRAKGKTAPKKYNFAPDMTRRGAKNAPIIFCNNNLINLSKTS